MEELKPCPFCGSASVKAMGPGYIYKARVGCFDCGAAGSYSDSKQKAIENWNTCQSISTEALESGAIQELVEAATTALEYLRRLGFPQAEVETTENEKYIDLSLLRVQLQQALAKLRGK